MTIQIHTPAELSNEDYQLLPQISGSALVTIYNESPAQWRYGEPETDNKALEFGIYSHAMILEPDRFDEQYVRDFSPDGYESILVTATDCSAWLKERGLKVSGAKGDLIERILATGEVVHIAAVEAGKYRQQHEGKAFIPAKDFDKISDMRAAIIADEQVAAMLDGGFAEYSIVSEEWKVRPDLMTKGGYLVNYKTTTSAHPREFGRKCHDLGYLLKAALECAMFKKAYGQDPRGYILLAQQKRSPYIFKPWRVSRELMEIGRTQLNEAIRVYRQCRDANVWPGLGGLEDMTLPDYIMNQYATK
jgi:exodeoxyribonuclease VIII